MLNPLREIAAAANECGVVTIVDAVSSLGGVPLPVDEWGIDVCVTVSNKCFACPPGLAPISVSRRAWSAEIANYLAKPLIEKFGILPDTDPDLFLCALYYKTFVASQAPDEGYRAEMLAPGGELSQAIVAESRSATNSIPVALISESADGLTTEESP